jgi:hypothetical protein
MFKWLNSLFNWVKDRKTFFGKFFGSVLVGIIITVVLFILLLFYECTCGSIITECSFSNCEATNNMSDTTSIVLLLLPVIAATVIGAIYAIATTIQESSEKNREQREGYVSDIKKNADTVGKAKNKSDNIVSLIKTAEKTIVSTRAKKILEEAAIVANTSALAMKEADKISKKAIGKTSKWASKNAQHAEDVSRLLEKDVDTAYDLYNQAKREEGDWNRIQQEASDAEKNAKNAKDDAEKEVAAVEKIVFVSAIAKDAADKAIYALAKAKDAAAETVKRADAAARATSAQNAQIEVFQAKYSEKRALVERKIAIEEAKIATEAEGTD